MPEAVFDGDAAWDGELLGGVARENERYRKAGPQTPGGRGAPIFGAAFITQMPLPPGRASPGGSGRPGTASGMIGSAPSD